MITIYLDMDGVLCDFYTEYKKYIPEGVRWCDKTFRKTVMEHDIFLNLEFMPNAKVLLKDMSILHKMGKAKVEILTSTGSDYIPHVCAAVRHKRQWLEKNVFGDYGFFNFNFVTDSKKKGEFAKPNSILIDDLDVSVDSFVSAGGIAVHHSDEKVYRTIETVYTIVGTLMINNDEHLLSGLRF